MPLMDEFREEREAMKHGTWKQKLEYFWCYYKWHTVAIIVGVICVISIARSILSAREPALNVAMLNGVYITDNTEQFEADFAELAGIDLQKNSLLFDINMHMSLDHPDQNTMNTTQKIMVNLAAGDLDMIMGCGKVFESYANLASFSDLRNILSAEQTSRYEPYFYYVDMSVVNKLEEMRSELQDISSVEIPDPKDPESMEQPVPVAVYIDWENSPLDRYYYFENMEEGLAVGVTVNTKHLENALRFIDYLMQQQAP